MSAVEKILQKAHVLLHSDFCPWANRWVYWIKHPLSCLIAAAIVAVCCGLFVNPVSFVFVALIVAVGGLGAAWPSIAVRGLKAEAEFITVRCTLGESVRVQLRIVNRYPWPAWGLSVQRGFFESGEDPRGLALARVAGWSETEFEWVFTPPRRGVYPLDRPSIDTGFPFGVWRAQVPIAVLNELVVWPATVTLNGLPDAAEIQSREDQLSDSRVGDCGDLTGIRPYRTGDALRRIHWPQTARTGRLIVIERQAPSVCAVRLVVEVDRSRHVMAPSQSSLERTLSLAASVLLSLHRQHAFVELQIHETPMAVGSSRRDLVQALDALARVPASGIVCGHTCHFDRPSRLLPTMAVVTDLALSHHRSHRHAAAGERFLVIRTGAGGESATQASDCDCRAWIDVNADEFLEDVLPERWRRACHAA